MFPRIKSLVVVSVLTLVGCSALSYLVLRSRTETSVTPGTSPSHRDDRSAPGAAEPAPAVPTPGEHGALLSWSGSTEHVRLDAHVEPLAYAQGWADPMPPAMDAFRSWALDYAAAETGFDQALMELEGVALARQRRAEMRALIENDPEVALALTVPATVRAVLPPSILDLLEERVSGRGDYEVLMAVQPIGSREAEKQLHRVTLAGRSYDAYVYGRRANQSSQQGASLHGIALDHSMALHESPLRVLEPGETVATGVPAGRCPVSAVKQAAIAPEAPVNTEHPTVVEVDGRYWQLESEDLIDALERRLVAAEDQPGPAVVSVMEPDPLLPLAPTSWTTGTKTLLIIRVDFSDKPGDPFAYQTTLDLMNNSVSPYYDAASYGTTSLATTVTASTYRMPQTAAYYATGDLTSQLYTDATAAAGADYTVANYQHVMILFTRLNSISGTKWTWAGLGSVGGGRTWINGYYDYRVTAHELGHNFGLYHANLWRVSDGNPASPVGVTEEYSDPFDTMGGGSTDARHHFNPWFKNRLGWLPDAAVRPITASGTYRLTRFDAKATPLDQSLALNVFCDGRRTYWIGFRQNLTSNASVANGAYVVWGFGSNQASQLLDMSTPGSSANDAGLPVGVTFTDAAHGVSIRPLAKGGSAPAEYLDVQVTLSQPSSPFVAGWGGSQAVSGLGDVTGVRAVASGSQHGLALRTDGTVLGWGNNSYGQTTIPAGLANAVSISARGNVSGAVTGGGQAVVWGDASAGQTTVPAGLSGVARLSIGGDHVLALRDDGSVVAWGNNSHGESTIPAGLTGVVAIAAGNNTSYAVRSNGTVTRWGSSTGTIPVGLANVVAIAAGGQHALALRADGTVVAWGDNTYGQATVPAGLTGISAVAAGTYHSIALRDDGTVVQWGYSGSTGSVPPALSRVSSVAANDSGNVVVIGAVVLSSPPAFASHPQNQSVTAGQPVQFSVSATGTDTLTYQWQRQAAGAGAWTDVANNAPYTGATSATLAIGSATGAMNGDQFRCVASYAGVSSVTSNAATLTVVSPPVIHTQPTASVGTAGGALTLSVAATGSGTLSYQWQLNGVNITGATGSTYTIGSLQAFHAGTYTVVVTAGSTSTTSAGATVAVNAATASTARPLNLSTRAYSQPGGGTLIPGFVIQGAGTKRLLIRAVGPTLAGMGAGGTLADPQFVLTRFNPTTQGYDAQLTNDDWGTSANAAQIEATAQTVGAFPLAVGSADAAALVDLPAGRYTVLAGGKNGASGLAMVELYDADTGTPTAQLVNISNRGFIGTGESIMIPGFVVSSEGSRTFLIRAVGPGLQSTFGLTGVLADPQIAVFKRRANEAVDDLILTNNDWDGVAGSATTQSIAAQVGAFALNSASKDAAFVVTLSPGVYTVHASGVGGSTGVALVEVYLAP